MKKIFLSYIWCVVALAFFAACADEELATGTVQIEKGIPVTVSLNYDVMAATSRTAQSEAVENKVNRVYAIAFHSDGTVSGRNSAEIVSGNSITLSMQSGAGQKIFLIANYDSGIGSLGLDELRNVNSYDEFKNLSSSLTEGYETQVERMSFLMVGQMKNTSEGEDINIDTDGKILNSTGKIQLNRVDARITFNVFAKNDNYTNFTFQPRYYRVERIPQGTYLVPQESDYESTTGESYVSMSEKNEQKNFDGVREVDSQNAYYFEFYLLENRQPYKKQITESEKTAKTDSYDNTGTENLYALREKRNKVAISDEDKKEGQEYQLGEWVYANENSTYVIIRGTLSYEDQTKNQFINADVTYTVHLGSTGNSSTTSWYDDVDLVNKYATERNTHYTYNVTITGVNSIKVEVTEDKEGRPGVEGDVIVAGGQVEDMDAHYGRTMFTLTRGNILDGLSWAFSTPFQRGMKVFNRSAADNKIEADLKTDLSLNDYKWVKFAINREYPQKGGGSTYGTDKLVKFPGEDAYNGGTGTNTPAPVYGGDGVSSLYYGNSSVKLYDVNQLLNHLYVEANNAESDIFMNDNSVSTSVNDRDATVTITAFVDEYVYVCDPTKYYYRAPKPVGENEEGVDLTLWKKVVNGDNRMLHICVAGAQYSPDGNSSWANSVISFSQRPIYTFYNPNDADLKTAWGVESKGETGEIGVELTGNAQFGNYYTNTSDNGRKNTLNILYSSTGWYPSLKNLQWDEVVSVDDAGSLLGNYNRIWYACLLRNRDLDGDNIVDEDEIRWYLASVDQLTDIWVGEAAIPTAKLYTKTASSGSVPMEHVACSSYFNNGGYNTPWIIWAEESASRGGYNDGGEDKYNSDGTRSYRTVRNLGISLDEVDAVPDDYVIKTSGTYTIGGVTYTEKIIDVSRMNSNAIRPSAANTILPYPLLERDENNNNRPPRKFAIIEEATNNDSGLYPQSESYSWLDIYSGERNGYPCPSGYRVPNQRELILMYTTYPELFPVHNAVYASNYEYLCKTGFSFNGWGSFSNSRYGFTYEVAPNAAYGNLRLIDGNFRGKVRCVRDVVE